MICPSCGHRNLPGLDLCTRCLGSLMQEDVPQPDTALRWRVMVDPVSSLDPSTIEPQVVPAGTSVAEGIRRMQEKNVGYLLVTGPDGALVGIFTEHDVLCQVAGQIHNLEGRCVEEFMQRDPATVHPDQPISHALHHMALNDFMYIPIVDRRGRPQDLLSFRRVARLIQQME